MTVQRESRPNLQKLGRICFLFAKNTLAEGVLELVC